MRYSWVIASWVIVFNKDLYQFLFTFYFVYGTSAEIKFVCLFDRCLLDLFSIHFLMRKLVQKGIYRNCVCRNRNIENMSIPNYAKSFKNIPLLYTTSQESCLLACVFIQLFTKKLGKRHLSQMRYIHLLI